VIGIGAGGHARVVLETLQVMGVHEIIGLLDARPELHGQRILGVPVLGDDGLLGALRDEGVRHFFLGIGSTKRTSLRRQVYERLVREGFEAVDVIHPSAAVSASATLGRGSVILAGAVVGPGVVLEENVIVNSGAVVEHDCIVGGHVHIASGAVLGGAVQVGTEAHIGSGAVVLQGLRIGSGATVGAGAAVISDVSAGTTVVGVPARALRSHS